MSTVIGPAAEDGNLRFILVGAAGGTGLSRVEGEGPSFTVRLDDGIFDQDFDDVVLLVQILEEAECPADPFFQNSNVQDALETLLRNSNFDSPQMERRERWLWIVERDGRFETVVLENEATNACSVAADPTPPEGVVGWVHTHPFERNERVAPGVCERFPRGGIMRRGPSELDRRIGVFINEEAGRQVPGFIIDPEGTIRFTVEEDPELGARTTSLDNFAGCIAGGDN